MKNVQSEQMLIKSVNEPERLLKAEITAFKEHFWLQTVRPDSVVTAQTIKQKTPITFDIFH